MFHSAVWRVHIILAHSFFFFFPLLLRSGHAIGNQKKPH